VEKLLAWHRKENARPVDGVVVSGRACCAARFWQDPLSTWSRTLIRVCLRALTLPVMLYLTLCYACSVYDRRQWIHIVWSQERRAGGASRCGSQFSAGLHCLDRLHAADCRRGR
jgi:hypothetical protein